MRCFCLVIAFLCAPHIAMAQNVAVRSGDHPGFARLVFDLPSRIGWSLENSAEGAELRFDAGDLSFDTGSVFQRIKRDRVADLLVDADSNTISIGFGCECRAEGFWFGTSMLVIDVAAIPEKDSPPTPAQSEQAVPEDDALIASLAEADGSPFQRHSPAADLMAKALAPDPNALDPIVSFPEQNTTDLDEAREHLVRQFGRAASQGLLSTQRVRSNPAKETLVEKPEQTKEEPKNMPQTSPERSDGTFNINVETSIDRAFQEGRVGQSLQDLSRRCLDVDLLDVASWGTDDPFWVQVGPLRTMMSGEFDRTDQRIARDLARTYIFFGFGREALQVIELLPDESTSTQVLETLAQIVEFGEATNTALSNQLDCDAANAMWSALSYAALPKDARLDKDAIQMGFAALPEHLRSHLGPLLAARFLDSGHEDASYAILRVLERNEETHSGASDLVAADLEFQNGESEQAENRLESVVEANDTQSPQALVRQIDSLIARGEPVSFDKAQLAAAYAFEHAGTDLGEQLSRAHVLALGASGAFESAYSELDSLETKIGDGADDIRSEVTTRLAFFAAPIELIQHVLAQDIGDVTNLTDETVLKIAEELIAAGFHDQSNGFLNRSFNGTDARRARLLRAEAALAMDQPRRAEVELLGVFGRDANTLRAQARSMIGEHKQAYELFMSAGLEEEAAREAWLANDGTQIEAPEGAEGAPNNEQSAAPSGVLARNRSLLDETSSTVDELKALLAKAPVPEAEK